MAQRIIRYGDTVFASVVYGDLETFWLVSLVDGGAVADGADARSKRVSIRT